MRSVRYRTYVSLNDSESSALAGWLRQSMRVLTLSRSANIRGNRINNACSMTYNNLQMRRGIIDRNSYKNALSLIQKPIGKHKIHRFKHVQHIKRRTDLRSISAEMRQIADSQVAFACDSVCVNFQRKYRRRQGTSRAGFSPDTLMG